MTKTPSKKAIQTYDDWHWGIGHSEVIEIDDDDLPEELIACGRFCSVRVRKPAAAPAGSMLSNRGGGNLSVKMKDAEITLSQEESEKSYLTFDPNHKHERLYVVLPPKVAKKLKRTYWDMNPFAAQRLANVAKHTGGRHGTGNDYPDVMVKPIGICTAVVYFCEKTGDGKSFYIHRLGEETGVRPTLCIDEQGRLWFAGGAYTSPTPGITD